MKLSDHVDIIRELIYKSFNKQFSSLGIGVSKQTDSSAIAEDKQAKRKKLDDIISNHIGETGSYEDAREKVLDELTFTLFNRLAALKVMEAHELFPPIVSKSAENGDRSFGHKVWLEDNPSMRSEELEGIREYFKFEFNKLGEALPLFHKDYPYALLPFVIELNEVIDAFNAIENDASVDVRIWKSDDILGWLYESYNNKKKQAHKDSKAKTEYDKVSIQSQVYTPRWVVEFLVHNSLGKLYLEMYPDSEIAMQYKIANAPKSRVREPKPLQEIKLIDPASGSGNFLLYAFEFFYALYKDQIENYGADYEVSDIPRLIIENNLHGIDLDDRAIQLAQLGLWIKAKQKNRKTTTLKFNVVSSDFFLPDYEEIKTVFEEGNQLDQQQKELIESIWTDLQQAYKFGSLVRIGEKLQIKVKGLFEKEKKGELDLFVSAEIAEYKQFEAKFFDNLNAAVSQYASSQGNSFITDKTKDAITFLKLVTQKYDVATANPPYTDSADFGTDLKKFTEANYKKPYAFHTNLYATFINRCYELTNTNGKVAMIHPRTFMFIKTFEDVRKFILEKTHLNVFVDYSLSNLFGSIMVDPAFYVFEKGITTNDKAWFVSLDQYTRTPNEKFKKDFTLKALEDFIDNKENSHNYSIPQSKLKIIKSYPFIYWISDEFREKFKGVSLFHNCQGLATADNNRFLRFWWELSQTENDILSEDWATYAKGGPFKKWSGNLWLKVKWSNNGSEIRNFSDENGKQRSRPQNEDYYFTEGITYSASGSKGPSFRYLPNKCIFDVGGSSIFPKSDFQNNYYILAFFNSKFTSYILNCLNPTVNSQVGDIQRIPLIKPKGTLENEITSLSKINVLYSNITNSFNIYDDQFKNPLKEIQDWKSLIINLLNFENYLISRVLINEAIINEKIFEVYELTSSDRVMVLEKEGESIGALPVCLEAKKAYLESEIAEFSLDNIRDYILNLPEKEFTAEEQEQIVSEFPSLYQSNNDLEEFCIRHQINPINVWYWFKESNIIPKQRMNTLAMEFLADMMREILLEDEDGIIPLVPNAGEKILLDRIEEKFIEKGFSMAQYSAFDGVLGRNINDYINGHFFKALSDHLNLFMYLPKTPFIWHLTSGPAQGFDCYIIIYKWSKDKLMRIRSVYIENRERALINRQTDLANDSSASAQNEKETIFKQLKEIESFKQKIDELLSEGYNPILDDGVGKNIAPLQKKKMLAYEVLNAGQLKTYFNADW